MKLIDAPVGLFEYEGYLALKTEYSTLHNEKGRTIITPDCYNVNGGEYFWGGVTTEEERNNLNVNPIATEGCYCKECEWQYSDNCASWYEEHHTYRDKWRINQETGFCSEGQKKGIAYTIVGPNQEFFEDLYKEQMEPMYNAGKYKRNEDNNA